MHTVYIRDISGQCLAQIFAEHGVKIYKNEFAEAVPGGEFRESFLANGAFSDSAFVKRLKFPIKIKDSASYYIKYLN
jgi:hypothetical protein